MLIGRCNLIMNVEHDRIMNTINKLFIMAIIVIPFNNLPYFKNILGEAAFQAPIYFFILIILLYFIKVLKEREIFTFNSAAFKVLIIFYIWMFISIIINIKGIVNASFKGRSGIEKLIFQIPIITVVFLGLYCIVMIMTKNNIDFKNIRKYILLSFIIPACYSILEVITLLRIVDASTIIERISYLIHYYYRGEMYWRGIRSVSGEASYFAMYVSFAIPWILSYVYTESGKKTKFKYLVIFTYIVSLIFLSKSRVGYIILVTQLVLFVIGIFITKSKKNIIITTVVVISIIGNLILIENVFYKENAEINTANSLKVESVVQSISDNNNMSNVARFGMQITAANMALDNPVFGVGLGQFGFHAKDYITKNALRSSEVKFWLDEKEKSGWPPAFSIYARILAEQGLIGLFLWISLWAYVILSSFIKYLRTKDIFLLTYIISTLGVLASGLNADTYLYFPYWICLGIFIVLVEKKYKLKEAK